MEHTPVLENFSIVERNRQDDTQFFRQAVTTILGLVTLVALTLYTLSNRYSAIPSDYQHLLIFIGYATATALSFSVARRAEYSRKCLPISDDSLTSFERNINMCLSIPQLRKETLLFIDNIQREQRRPVVMEAESLEAFTLHCRDVYWKEVVMSQIWGRWSRLPPILIDQWNQNPA